MTDTRAQVLALLTRLRGRGFYSAGECAAILQLPRARVKDSLEELAAAGEVQTRAMEFHRNGGFRTGTGYGVEGSDPPDRSFRSGGSCYTAEAQRAAPDDTACALASSKGSRCTWTLDEAGGRANPFRQCLAPTAEGSELCAEHEAAMARTLAKLGVRDG